MYASGHWHLCFYVNSKEHFPQGKGVLTVFSDNLYHLFDRFRFLPLNAPDSLLVGRSVFITFVAVAFGVLKGRCYLPLSREMCTATRLYPSLYSCRSVLSLQRVCIHDVQGKTWHRNPRASLAMNEWTLLTTVSVICAWRRSVRMSKTSTTLEWRRRNRATKDRLVVLRYVFKMCKHYKDVSICLSSAKGHSEWSVISGVSHKNNITGCFGHRMIHSLCDVLGRLTAPFLTEEAHDVKKASL